MKIIARGWNALRLRRQVLLRGQVGRAGLLAVCLLLFAAGNLGATTTSALAGGTRNVLVDGVVNTGALAGTNGPNWETDEEFQGFQGPQGAVNWYLTWDDNNVYLGRIGGNNSEGSVIYIRADYAGASFANRGFQNYDSLQAETSKMGGINFAAYMKLGYNEYRTYNGAWSSPTVGALNFVASTQGLQAHAEVAIPWSAITGGAGAPNNVRLVMYQVVPTANPPACTPAQHFVYGESPWGTGLPNDGPSIGLNDGQPTSARQPGGCGVGSDTLTRWWGCYPVIGGVGANGWVAVMPDAGLDDTICGTGTAYFLQGNTPPGTAQGNWEILAWPSGLTMDTISNDTVPNAYVFNMLAVGSYGFSWSIQYGGCPSRPDSVIITRILQPPVAVAMQDTVLGCLVDSMVLHGSSYGAATAQWSLLSGSGTISQPNDSITAVYGLTASPTVFVYVIDNGICPATRDTVVVTRPSPVQAIVGNDTALCEGSSLTLSGNDPSLVQFSAHGVWTQLTGPNNINFTNPAQANTNINGLQSGQYLLLWTVINGNCPLSVDTFSITNFAHPVADAGGDQTHCLGDPVNLDGNDTTGLGIAAYGVWSQLPGGPSQAVFADSTLRNTAVTNLVEGLYQFVWTMHNGSCVDDHDNVYIRIVDLRNNGFLNTILPDSGQNNGTILVAPPTNGNSPYLYSIDGLNFTGNGSFDSLGAGNYTFYIMDANGCHDSLSAVLAYQPPIHDTTTVKDSIVVPTGFSPNADGNNDTWEIPGIEHFPDAQIDVFNIWGGLVFRSVGSYTPWNGQRNGQDLPSANYYFVIDLKTAGQPLRKGSLTLLR